MFLAPCLLAGLAAALPASAGVPSARHETPVTTHNLRVAQNSPALAADPAESRLLALASRQDAPDFGCALYLSGDGGESWTRANPVPRLPAGAEKCYAPEVAIDREGVLHYLFVGLSGRGNVPMGAFLSSSADRGRSFGFPRKVLGPNSFQVRMAIDQSHGKTGRMHLVWLKASATPPLGGMPPVPNPIMAIHSDDGGKSFSDPVQVNASGTQRVVAPAVVVGRDGEIHVAYYDLMDDLVDYHGLEGPVWEGHWSLIVSSSSGGGRIFTDHQTVDEKIVPPERVMLIFTMPAPALAAGPSGGRFTAWTDAREGDPDVFFSRSGQVNRAWTEAVRLNQDLVGNARTQSMPALAVSQNGRVDTIFYDRRNDPENLGNHVFYNFSIDHGRTFSQEVRLTEEESDSRIGQTYPLPSAQGLVEFGSRLGLASQNEFAVAAWTDTRNAVISPQQDIFSSRIEFPAPDRGFFGRRGALLSSGAVFGAGLLLWGASHYRNRRQERRRP